MSDEEDIRQLISRFALALDDAQFDEPLVESLKPWSELFIEDAIVDISEVATPNLITADVPLRQVGRNAIREAAAKSIAVRPVHKHPSKHVCFNSYIRVDRASPRGTTDFFVLNPAFGDQKSFVITDAGRYYDFFVKSEGGWFFAERRVTPFVRHD